MTGRVYRAVLQDVPVLPRGRIYRASFPGAAPAVVPHGRIYRAAFPGTAPTVPHGRIYRASFPGTLAVVVTPIPDRVDIEPESTIAIAATLVGGGAADSWTFRRVSGPTIGINGTGPNRTFTAPSQMAGATVVVGIRATIDGIPSPEVFVSYGIRPQNRWWWTPTGYVPRTRAWRP